MSRREGKGVGMNERTLEGCERADFELRMWTSGLLIRDVDERIFK